MLASSTQSSSTPTMTLALEFDGVLTSMFIDLMVQNEELFAEFMGNDEVQEAITNHLRQQVYQESQAAEG